MSMPNSKSLRISFLSLIAMLLITSCYHKHERTTPDAITYTEEQLDSISFSSTHHYTNNYNFVVKADSLVLLKQQPEEKLNSLMTDSFVVKKHDALVVADIRILPTDSIESVWVQVARDQSTFGWIHESTLLKKVVPDDPISQFISTFSDIHMLIFLIIIVVIGTVYIIRMIRRRNAKLVHFNDIDSFYPTALALLVASSATLYATIQVFAPDMWRHFYYHPTLNPFIVPPLLSIFLVSVWTILIVGLATVDDVRHHLPFSEAVLYLFGLTAICAVDYIVFSVFTLYYIGYVLLVVYFYFAIKTYLSNSHTGYLCGNCGAQLLKKGKCPYCGAENQ
ncbi:MAG: zinc ribbon domain-containing protein [Prevotella sp.]|nr:zinc ribbon domain-containing protein [Prevotella sp.]